LTNARNAGPVKSNQKRLLLRSARSLRLGVPSLRDRSGRSAYGLLRCTSSRCVWLRQTVAALPRPDQPLHSAFRRRSWIKIKSCSRACAHPASGAAAPRISCRSCRRLRSFGLAFVGAKLARERRCDSQPIPRMYTFLGGCWPASNDDPNFPKHLDLHPGMLGSSQSLHSVKEGLC
jgi:hypothetical protein